MIADAGLLLGEIGFLLLIFMVTMVVCAGLLAAMGRILGWGRRGDSDAPPPS